MVDFPDREFQARWHADILANRGPYPDQYRFLTFWLAEGLKRLGMSLGWAHGIVRGVFTFTSLYVFQRYLEGWFRPRYALLGTFMLATAIPFTYGFYGMQVTDPLNMLVYFLAIWAIRERREPWLYPLVLVGMLNRETVILIPLLYAFIRAGEVPLSRWLPHAVGLAAVAVAAYLGLRIGFGWKKPYAASGLQSVKDYWYDNATVWWSWVQVLAFFNVTLLLWWKGLRVGPRFLRRAFWILPLFVVIHLSVGNLWEIRYYLPLAAILVPLALFALADRPGEEVAPEVRANRGALPAEVESGVAS